jgi:hypothetical protein
VESRSFAFSFWMVKSSEMKKEMGFRLFAGSWMCVNEGNF